MAEATNILFLMADQMQGRVLRPGHPCLTPCIDRLTERGVRFERSYTPCAICSPARASLMTGLLPHNHGVQWVTQNVDEDLGLLRVDKRHWAQQLTANGYHTGYFGKWHVEHRDRPEEFGWQVVRNTNVIGTAFPKDSNGTHKSSSFVLSRYVENPPGYDRRLLYGVTSVAPDSETRQMGNVYHQASSFLKEALAEDLPWCCFVSFQEPHDPFICGEKAFKRYDIDALELPPNSHVDQERKPGLYAKAAQTFIDMTDLQRREAMACYYASISEIDELWGRLIDLVEEAGQLDDTIIIVTSDHGELLGAHGLYCKNLHPGEEVYNIPLVISGPGIAFGQTTTARVGLHDLCPTLLELASAKPIDNLDAKSFAKLLPSPELHESEFHTGYAEYHGGRYLLTQRIFWEDNWKFVFNGFDWDELYDLANDPYEMNNLAQDPAFSRRLRYMMSQVWKKIADTNDRSLINAVYPGLRPTVCGPKFSEDRPIQKSNI